MASIVSVRKLLVAISENGKVRSHSALYIHLCGGLRSGVLRSCVPRLDKCLKP